MPLHTQHTLAINPTTTINYIDTGKGKHTILFIHGLASVHAVWQHNIAYLQKKYRCIAIDLPGYGGSTCTASGGMDLLFYTNCIAAFVQKLNLQNFTLIGHSMGGQIAILFAGRFAALIHKLILVAPAGIETFNPAELFMMRNTISMGAMFANNPQQVLHMYKDGFNKNTTHTQAYFTLLQEVLFKKNAAATQNVISQNMLAMLAEPVHAFLPQLQMPVLMCFGAQDALIPNKMLHLYSTQYLAEGACHIIKNSTSHMFADCGHFLQWEDFEQFNTVVSNYILD
jgi:pimeloyl-ACP methyl ester carboxylesterase